MAGNSTSVPLIQEAMESLFGSEKVRRDIHPKHCMALGAATCAARIQWELEENKKSGAWYEKE